MASSTLQKLLRSQTRPASHILFHLRKPLAPIPLTDIPLISDPADPISNRSETGCVKPNQSSIALFYPGFSLGFFLNPNSASSLIRPESEATEEDSNVIRADSVKKKRKKKMNKHKLKKLRKRLRRKT